MFVIIFILRKVFPDTKQRSKATAVTLVVLLMGVVFGATRNALLMLAAGAVGVLISVGLFRFHDFNKREAAEKGTKRLDMSKWADRILMVALVGGTAVWFIRR
jgi:hypothetical protein